MLPNLPTAHAHLVKSARRWQHVALCPVCGEVHSFDAGPSSAPPITLPGLSVCEGRPFLVLSQCAIEPCPGCPARPQRQN